MKILLISDIHFGVKNNSEEFLKTIDTYFKNDVFNQIKIKNIQQLWILGDLFDNPTNTDILVESYVLNIFDLLLKSFPNLTIHLLLGNHEIYFKTTLEVSSLNIFKNFNSRLTLYNTVQELYLDSCKVLIVPWLIKGSKNYSDFERALNKSYDVCFGHFSINGFEIIKGRQETHGLNQSLFKNFGEVFSGHFHIRKKYGNIQYLGCPYEITWNDYGDIKGLTIFDTETKQAEFIENTISPKHKIIRLSSIAIDKNIMKECKGNFVKYIIDKTIDANVNDKIEAFFKANSQKLTIINETEFVVEEVETEIDSDNLQIDSKKFLIDFVKETKLPEDIDPVEFELYISKKHDEIKD